METPLTTSPPHFLWRRAYWLYAAALPALLWLAEALKTLTFDATRAPNVSLVTQLVFMLGFYGLWTVVPRILWWVYGHNTNASPPHLRVRILRMLAVGVAASTLHLFLLALVLRVMHSPPGWGPSHLLGSFGEVWLANIVFWWLAFGAAVALIAWRRAPGPLAEAPVTRYEVKQNGKTWTIPYRDIYWMQAAGNYVELFTAQGKLMVRKTLATVAHEVSGGDFIQSHRSALINGHHVVAIKPDGEGSGYRVQLSNDAEAPLSRRKLGEVRQRLKQID